MEALTEHRNKLFKNMQTLSKGNLLEQKKDELADLSTELNNLPILKNDSNYNEKKNFLDKFRIFNNGLLNFFETTPLFNDPEINYRQMNVLVSQKNGILYAPSAYFKNVPEAKKIQDFIQSYQNFKQEVYKIIDDLRKIPFPVFIDEPDFSYTQCSLSCKEETEIAQTVLQRFSEGQSLDISPSPNFQKISYAVLLTLLSVQKTEEHFTPEEMDKIKEIADKIPDDKDFGTTFNKIEAIIPFVSAE